MVFNYHKQETNYTCGAAAMRMVLEYFGIKKSEKQIVNLLGTNKVRGTWIKNFPSLAERLKLNYIVKRNSRIEDLKEYQKKGYQIIICYLIPKDKVDHYSVLKKIDSKNIYFFDPWYGAEHKLPLNYFKKIWYSDKRYEKEKAWFIAIKK
jgi:predicted double-glycine peptidase